MAAGNLASDVMRLLMYEIICLLGSNQLLAAIFCQKDRGALVVSKRPMAAMRTSFRSPKLFAKLAKIAWTCC